MRFVYRAMCAAALVGCTDVKTPVESKIPSVAPAKPVDRDPEQPAPGPTVDSRSIADRVDGLFGKRLSKVSIPSDGFSQASDAVHPDMACPPDSWNGARCWLLYTPYRNSDPAYENPAFLEATTDSSWRTPDEVKNPIIPHPGTGYNSDPDHAFDPTTRRMVQVYRVVSDSFNKIMIMSTANARQWTTPVVAFKELNHDAISPALIIEPDRSAKLWYVRTGPAGCNALSSSVELRMAAPDGDSRYEHSIWSPPTPVTMSIPRYVVWHLDVIKTSADVGYVALIAAYPIGSNCANSDLWIASSRDGITWQTYGMPILWRSMNTAKQRAVSTWYRGTLRYDAISDSLHVWPSALSGTVWSVYHASLKLSELLPLLGSMQPGEFRPPSLQRINAAPIRMP
jgi:hypothetical protein